MFSSFNIKVNENSHNEAIGQFNVLDPDQHDLHKLSLTEGNDLFELREYGMLWVMAGQL